jgi:hypothetical protein
MAGNIEDIPLKISSIENELSIAKDDITGIKTILYELIQRNPDISTLDGFKESLETDGISACGRIAGALVPGGSLIVRGVATLGKYCLRGLTPEQYKEEIEKLKTTLNDSLSQAIGWGAGTRAHTLISSFLKKADDHELTHEEIDDFSKNFILINRNQGNAWNYKIRSILTKLTNYIKNIPPAQPAPQTLSTKTQILSTRNVYPHTPWAGGKISRRRKYKKRKSNTRKH